MTIVIEETLLICLVLNSFIIKLTAMFLKDRARLWLLSALIGSIISIMLPLFHIKVMLKLLIVIFSCSLLVCISFKFLNFKRFLAIFGVFVLTTFVFGGGCYAVESLIGSFPLFCVAIIAVVLYVIVRILLIYQQRRDKLQRFTYNVTIKDGDKVIYEEGYLDSGNVLYDTITKKPIILVTFDVFNKLYQNINYINALTKNFDKSIIKDGHFIKINGVGSGTSILVFTIDEMLINNDKSFKDVAVGLSFSSFDKSFRKKILLNNVLI